jgi:F0F1-type ATP synthase membrane subunit b/b'
MSNTVVILTEEFLTRIHVALGEIQAKFAIPVINEVQQWIDKAEKEPTKLVADIDAHLVPFRAKIAAAEAESKKILEAAAAKAAEIKHAAIDVIEKAV